MRPEQIDHDSGPVNWRVSRDRTCEWCDKPLVGNETERFYWDRPLLCRRCADRWRRQRRDR